MPLDHALETAAAALFARLRELSFDGAGITRESLGPKETAAHELVAEHARAAGLEVSRDRAANLVVTLQGRDPARPFLVTGSHLDSVPRGGNYDGAAGVLAGLLALESLKRDGVTPPRTVRLYALRGEESAWFGKSWIGSHALFGLLADADLAQRREDSGRSMAQCLQEVGADLAAISAREPLLDVRSIAAFIEVHIEQGPVLEARGVPLGVVSAIFGNLRHRRVRCHGEAAHAGATPRELRHDAVVALADLVMRIDAHWSRWLQEGRELVVTHGIIGTDPAEHAISRVAGDAMMSIEIRAADDATLYAFHELVQREAQDVAATRRVTFEFDAPIVNPAAPMHAGWSERLAGLCEQVGTAHIRLPSGAGHDASVFARAGVPTAMLFIRNQNGSHNPHEDMRMGDFMAAIRVLRETLLTDPVDQ